MNREQQLLLLQMYYYPVSHYTIGEPRAGSGVVRIDPLHFLAGCRLVSVLLGRLPKVDLIILEGENVRPYACPYVRQSFHKKFLRFQ